MKNLLHKIAHWLGLNYGLPYSFYLGEDLWMGFKCTYCGRLDDIREAHKEDF